MHVGVPFGRHKIVLGDNIVAGQLVGPLQIDEPAALGGGEHIDLVPPVLRDLARNLLTSRPRLVDPAACTRCGDCAQICGANAITLAPTPVYDDAKCVRCYACTEICPTAAIQDVRPLTLRLFGASR